MKLVGVNRSGQRIPPYAVVSLLTDLDGTNGMRVRSDGSVEVDVFQCRDFDEHLQNPSLLAVVGATGLGKGESGDITQQWPALVRVEDVPGGYNGLQRGGYVPGWRVGVREGSWGVAANSAGAFGYLGPAVSTQGKDVTTTGASTHVALGSISALVPQVSPGMFFSETIAAMTVADGTTLSPLSSGVVAGEEESATSLLRKPNGLWIFRFSGAYIFHFHGAFRLGGTYSPSVELVPSVSRKAANAPYAVVANEVDLPFRAYAEVPASYQDVYNDAGDYSVEDVTMVTHLSLSGVMMAAAGDGFRIRVECTGSTHVVSGPGITVHRVGPYYVSDDYTLRTATP